MKFVLYHATPPDFFARQKKFDKERYTQIGEIECAGLEELFRITNHIHGPWTVNREIARLDYPAHKCRSTSVGDVAIDETGQMWRCEMVGWKEFE